MMMAELVVYVSDDGFSSSRDKWVMALFVVGVSDDCCASSTCKL